MREKQEFLANRSFLLIKFVGFMFQVGDFGLARWQPDGDLGVQTRVIGTFG